MANRDYFQKQRISAADSRIAVAEIGTRLDALDEDQHDLRAAFSDLGRRIDELGNTINRKIDERSQPQWTTYIAGATFIGALFFAFISPIQKTNDVQDQALRDLVMEHRSFVKSVGDELTRRNDYFVSNRTHEDLVKRIERTEVRNKQDDLDLKELIGRVATRLTTHEGKEETAKERLATRDDLQRSLLTTKSEFGAEIKRIDSLLGLILGNHILMQKP